MSVVEFQARSERLRDGTRIVAVAGELDLYTAPELEQALLAIDGARAVVDLSECTFIDSTALALLVEANSRLGYPQARLSIVAAAAEIRRPFELTGLDRRFAFYPTMSAALEGAVRDELA